MQFIRFNLTIFLLFSLVSQALAKEEKSVFNTKDSDNLNVLVEQIVDQAKNSSNLREFKRLKEIVIVPFNSTPLFLQTLESLKLAEEKKNEIFSKFLPRATSSIGGGIKSGGLNNDTNSKSINFNVSQLVYDFGVTKRQVNASKQEMLATQSRVDTQRTELLLEIISALHEVYRAKTQLLLSQGFVEVRRGFLLSMKEREKLGGSSGADVIRAETKLSDALDKIPLQVRMLRDSEAKVFEFFAQGVADISLTKLPNVDSQDIAITDEILEKNFKILELLGQVDAARLNFEAERRTSFGKFALQAGYQNTDTNLLSPQEQSSLLLTYQVDVFTGFERSSKIAQAGYRVSTLEFELERVKREIKTQLGQSINAFDAQSASVLSRAELVVGAKLSNEVNKELFELNKTSINDLFRSQEEYISAAKNLVDAMVDKNISFYQMMAKFGLLLSIFDLGA